MPVGGRVAGKVGIYSSHYSGKIYNGINEEIIWLMKSIANVAMVTDTSFHRPLGRFAQLSRQLILEFTSALQSRKTNHELIILPSKWNVKSMMIPAKTYEEIEFASKRKIQQSAAPIYIPMFQSIKRLTSMEETENRGKK